MENELQCDKVIDLRGWSCPWCILKAKSLLRQMEPGQVLEVLSTDPEIQTNFPHILEQSKDRVIMVEKHAEYFRVLVRSG